MTTNCNLFVISVYLSFQFQPSFGVQLWRGATEIKPSFVGDAKCFLPRVRGPCRASVPRFFYNLESKACEPFYYGGCSGNGNNFETLEECRGKCGERVEEPTQEGICSGPPEQGRNCEAIIPRWTFNTTTKQCTQFIYGGCGATGNNFVNLIDCQLQCGDTSSCSLPKNSGPCMGAQKYWWFDAETKECLEFDYGGCAGNSNRFDTQTQCEQVCKSEPKQEAQGESCDGVRCPGGVSHYKELNCKPIYDDGACCPTRYECPEREVSRNGTQCVYKNKVFNVGESVRSADSDAGCRAGCTCTESGINCAHIECADVFGYYPKEGCQIGLYKPGTCCAYDYACGNETAICEFEGSTYVENERIYPKAEPCLRCYCKPGFNGTLSEEFCEKIDCGIQIWYRNELERGCTPVYFQNRDFHIGCCPISWQCPEDYENKISRLISKSTLSIQVTTALADEILVEHVTSNGNVNATESPITEVVGARSNETVNTVDVDPIDIIAPRLQDKSNATKIEIIEDLCSQPLLRGDCKASRLRYFYNSSSNECEQFFYSGCRGNENNFHAVFECRSRCVRKAEDLMGRFASVTVAVHHADKRESDPCTLPVSPGRCRAFFPRYYFNVELNQCQFFIFGGCQRNENNFFSLASCEATCTKTYPNVCDHKPMDLLKDCGGQNTTKFYFDSEVGYCKRFTSTGCTGQNVFNRLSECDSVCMGGNAGAGAAGNPVLSAIPKREFVPIIPVFKIQSSASSGSSSSSSSSGIPSFSNSFAISSSSSSSVNPSSSSSGTSGSPSSSNERDKICLLPKKVGSCYAQISSYYYDVTARECKSFIYGGCFGNLNRFPSLESCRTTCEPGINGGSSISFDEHHRPHLENGNVVRQPLLPANSIPPQMTFSEGAGGDGQKVSNQVQAKENSQKEGLSPVTANKESTQIEESSFIFSTSGQIQRKRRSDELEEMQKHQIKGIPSKPISENEESAEYDSDSSLTESSSIPIVRDSEIDEKSLNKTQVKDPSLLVGRSQSQENSLMPPQSQVEKNALQNETSEVSLIEIENVPGKELTSSSASKFVESKHVWKFRDPIQMPASIDLIPPQTKESTVEDLHEKEQLEPSNLVEKENKVENVTSKSEEEAEMAPIFSSDISPRLLRLRPSAEILQTQVVKEPAKGDLLVVGEQTNKTEVADADLTMMWVNNLQLPKSDLSDGHGHFDLPTIRSGAGKSLRKPHRLNEDFTKGICKEALDVGTCNQTILRFYWDGQECRAFNFTGCSGNKNRFKTEYECRQICDENFQDITSTLYCIFGNHVIPFGRNLDEKEACGVEFCTCSVPPSLTCTVKSC